MEAIKLTAEQLRILRDRRNDVYILFRQEDSEGNKITFLRVFKVERDIKKRIKNTYMYNMLLPDCIMFEVYDPSLQQYGKELNVCFHALRPELFRAVFKAVKPEKPFYFKVLVGNNHEYLDNCKLFHDQLFLILEDIRVHSYQDMDHFYLQDEVIPNNSARPVQVVPKNYGSEKFNTWQLHRSETF